MAEKFENFDIREAQRLANSDVGKQLMAMLQSKHAGQMQKVMDSMKAGDVEQAKQALSTFMADEQTKELLKRLQEERHG